MRQIQAKRAQHRPNDSKRRSLIFNCSQGLVCICVLLSLSHTHSHTVKLPFGFLLRGQMGVRFLTPLSFSFPRDIFLCFTSFSSIDPSSSILFTLLYFFVSPSLTVFKFLIVGSCPEVRRMHLLPRGISLCSPAGLFSLLMVSFLPIYFLSFPCII